MPLPEPILDDLRFQRDLVDEARRRIVRYCPEWTDYNLSDPGITLIELFAWMTEMMVYRLNRVPDKNYVKFMEMLGMSLMPASSARVPLTFRLSTQLPVRAEDDTQVVVPAGLEVSSMPGEDEQEVTFTTDDRLAVVAPVLTQLRRDADFHKNYLSRLGIETFYPFQRTPQPGDTFFLGFDETRNIAGHILQLAFETQETQATGIKRNDPPLVWECSMGNGVWKELTPSILVGERDTTGGLNNPTGALTFYLPLEFQTDVVNGREAFWIRCRVEQRRREQGMYTQSPRITGVMAYATGASTMATHAVIVQNEILGRSDGEPSQRFTLQNAPVLTFRAGEDVEVEEKQPDGDVAFVPWTRVNDFANSTRYDRHYVLDTDTGTIIFGPSVRQRDGTVLQYGRVPEANATLRVSRYRYGGGVVGNVAAGRLLSMRSAVPYVSTATNLERATGGRDAETLDEAKLRARREIIAQQRAVTADDYENLALGASRAVARVKCQTPSSVESNLPPGTLELLVIPSAFDSLKVGDNSKLALDPDLARLVQMHMDKYRLLTATVQVREPQYIGVQVKAEIVATPYSQPEVVMARVKKALNEFISPLAIGDSDAPPLPELGSWEGWPFGRDLFIAELFALLQKVPGVKHVVEVKLQTRTVNPADELASSEDSGDADEAVASTRPVPELRAVAERRLVVPADGVLVSLAHEVNLVEL